MNRPMNYRTKSLKKLLEAYSFENNRINKKDAEVTDVETVYKQFIEY